MFIRSRHNMKHILAIPISLMFRLIRLRHNTERIIPVVRVYIIALNGNRRENRGECLTILLGRRFGIRVKQGKNRWHAGESQWRRGTGWSGEFHGRKTIYEKRTPGCKITLPIQIGKLMVVFMDSLFAPARQWLAAGLLFWNTTVSTESEQNPWNVRGQFSPTTFYSPTRRGGWIRNRGFARENDWSFANRAFGCIVA